MDSLRETLREAMMGYAVKGYNGVSYLTHSDDEQLFTVVGFGNVHGKRIVDLGLVARLVDDKIVIERDINDKILADALLQAGIPREQIVLAYAGEKVEEAV
jgi:hypothetical protein